MARPTEFGTDMRVTIPAALADKIRKIAEREKRNINQQVEVLLEKVLSEVKQ